MADNQRNVELVRTAKSGSREALDRLLRENAGLVKSVALRFCGRGQDIEDLIQIGNIGLMKSITRFDESLGYAFSTYAVHSIAGELKRFLRDDGWIKVSRSLKQKGYALLRASEKFRNENGREPRLSELAELCGMAVEEVSEALEAQTPALSLQERTGDEDSPLREELVGEDHSDEIDERIALEQAIERLPSEERLLIRLRYYRGLTQSESAKLLGLTQVKVSRSEKKILEKLRREMTV